MYDKIVKFFDYLWIEKRGSRLDFIFFLFNYYNMNNNIWVMGKVIF